MAKLENPEKVLSERMDKLCHDIEEEVKKSIEEPPPENRFESVKLLRERAALEVREGIKSLQMILDKGMQAVVYALTELKKEDELQEILDWFDNNMDKVNDFLNSQDPDQGGKTIEEQLDFPRKHIISMHDAATFLLNEKKYDEALGAITICLQFNPALSPLWFTYGSILQNRGDQEAALYVFQMAAILDEQNPYIPAHMARSWIALDDWPNAELAVQEAKALCQNFPEYLDLLKYCDELEDWMKKNKKPGIEGNGGAAPKTENENDTVSGNENGIK